MAEGFNREEVAALLVRCHRRCCICHRFCGTKIETDHIVQAADSHDHSIENAIPVCFDCHAEIHAYNPKHPRGRKFTAEELRKHKEQWLNICENRPEILLEANREIDIGPMQGLLDELDYNLIISGSSFGFIFKDEQITRAIREGVLSILDDDLKKAISLAYGAISQANAAIHSHHNQSTRDMGSGLITSTAQDAVQRAIPLITLAHEKLLAFFKSE